ncbi:uncharacterized protein LOC143290913 isoform X2 [Babylonia areolata]|uniref:uncharacterized protein LOC143290913 isoform X2 n=1 Tax=Babylonia areolata TaxID=304850 RepID=UPI003FD16428
MKMDSFAIWGLIIASIMDFAEGAVKCHDCTSWNPYCQETVDAPFDSAVATVECNVTSTCYVRQEASGEILRGCADGWVETLVDLTLLGCHKQHVPWLGDMVWCFCKQDYCNGGPVTVLDDIQEKTSDAHVLGSQTVGGVPSDDYTLWEEKEEEEGEEEGKKNEKGEKGAEEDEKVEEEAKRKEENSQKKGEEEEEAGDDKKEQEEEEEEVDNLQEKIPDAHVLGSQTMGGVPSGWAEEGEEEEKAENEKEEKKEEEEEEEKGQDWQEEHVVEDSKGEGEEEGEEEKVGEGTDDEQSWGKVKANSDVTSDDGIGLERKRSGRKYQLWFWHANSDRPVRTTEGDDGKERWRAPQWVEIGDGKGWDFPVTGHVHQHTAGETEDLHDHAEDDVDEDDDGDDVSASAAATGGRVKGDTWNWGEGWGHIRPWWLGEEENQEGSLQPSEALGPDEREDEERGGRPQGSDVVKYDHDHSVAEDQDVFLEVKASDFFCWDCNSKSPLCGETVETQMANHLGKIACTGTRKCFVRTDGKATYRGCADGWRNSLVDLSYVGCRVQSMGGREVEWCFCTASLCNGDSGPNLQHKYSQWVQPFRGFVPARTQATKGEDRKEPVTIPRRTAFRSFIKAAPERSRTSRYSTNRTTDFRSDRTALTSHQNGIPAEEDSDATRLSANWRATEAGSDIIRSGSDVRAQRNESEDMLGEAGASRMNYKAFGG